jgi:hypothetical protein
MPDDEEKPASVWTVDIRSRPRIDGVLAGAFGVEASPRSRQELSPMQIKGSAQA